MIARSEIAYRQSAVALVLAGVSTLSIVALSLALLLGPGARIAWTPAAAWPLILVISVAVVSALYGTILGIHRIVRRTVQIDAGPASTGAHSITLDLPPIQQRLVVHLVETEEPAA